MKKLNILLVLLLTLSLSGCLESIKEEQFTDQAISSTIKVQLSMPVGYNYSLQGLIVKLSDPSSGLTFQGETDAQGLANIRVAYGNYIATAETKHAETGGIIYIFNGTSAKIRTSPLDPDVVQTTLPLNVSKSGQVIIKEFYYGGCFDIPTNKNYSKDQYFILYNNTETVAYLDSLCVGAVSPYNAPTSGKLSQWVKTGTSELRDSVPLISFGWMFPGTGNDYPLAPGAQVVISLNGIDHSSTITASVNLGISGYWAAYDPVNTRMQSAPNAGVLLLNNFWKNGTATSWVVSTLSPALFIFTLGGKTAAEFVTTTYTDDPSSTSTISNCLMVDKNLVLDGVETYRNLTDSKRLRPEIDNGFTITDGSGQGQSVHRIVDLAATAAAGGRIVYQDSNNSSADFVKTTPVSLK